MSNVLNFLECLGGDAELRNAEENDLKQALAKSDIAPAIGDAILSRDRAKLEELLSGKTNVCCGVFPGKEDEDESEEEPSKDDEEVVGRNSARNVA
jgi:hypothetical protein